MFDDDPRIDPADLRRVRFPSSFRGYDAKAVDDFLESVAARVEETNALLDRLRFEVEGSSGSEGGGEQSGALLDRLREELEGGGGAPAQPPAAVGVTPTVEPPDLSTMDDEELLRLVGEETAHVLATARRAATEIRSKAEEAAARVIRESTADASRAIEAAEERAAELEAAAAEVHRTALASAEAEAEEVRAGAAAEVERMLAEAREEVESLRTTVETTRAEAAAEAERIVDEAKDEGRTMIAEAKEVRGRVLEDLQRRRDIGRSQVERLAAGRDQLLDAYAAVRANVDEITAKLDFGLFEVSPAHDPLLDDGFAGIVDTGAAAVPDLGDRGSDEVTDDLPDDDRPHHETLPAGDPDDVHHEPLGQEPEATGDEIEPEDEPDDRAAPSPDEAAEPASTAIEADADPEPDVVLEPDAPAAAGQPTDVDALFAKIRAERAQSVARAQQVLDSGSSAEPEPEPEPELEPEPEPEAAVERAPDEDGPATAEPAAAERSSDQIPDALLADADLLQQRAESLAPLDKKLSRALKRHLADEQNVVLDVLRRTESTVVHDLLPPADQHIAGYAAAALVHLQAAADAGAGSDDSAVDVSGVATTLGATLVEAFRRRIERSAAEIDGDADLLDERLRALYREWKVEHIGSLTTDALLSAHALGQYAAAPDGLPLRWLIDPEQGPCPDAQDNALAGPVIKGDPFPTGDICPQAHPGCRCVVVADA